MLRGIIDFRLLTDIVWIYVYIHSRLLLRGANNLSFIRKRGEILDNIDYGVVQSN